jgi:hypothetical protein
MKREPIKIDDLKQDDWRGMCFRQGMELKRLEAENTRLIEMIERKDEALNDFLSSLITRLQEIQRAIPLNTERKEK